MGKKYIIDEKPFYTAASYYVVEQLLKGIKPTIKEDIVTWCESTIDLGFDKTSSATGLVKLYPYQREILRACDDASVQEVTIQAGQRLGKSSIWKYALLKRIHDNGLSGMVVYPSLELGERTNRDTLLPLLQTLPEVAHDLAIRGNRLKNSYHIPSQNSIIYFVGSGSQVISSTCDFVVLDESDFCELQNDDDEKKNMSQIKALRLRMQTFKNRMFIVCSSPTQYGGVVHRNWERGSRGEWNLRCLHCGELSPVKQLAFFTDGSKWAGLQWRKDDNGEIIDDSIRWICPHCLHEHTFADAYKMNELGQFVHQRPSNLLHRSFQIGALANPLFSWREIAQAQEDAIDGDGKKYLNNTILGMPYKHVAEGDSSVSIEETNRKRQIEYPNDLDSKLSIVLMAVDQQKSEVAGAKYFVSVVRGWCEDGSSFLLSAGTDNSLDAVLNRLQSTYYGHKVSLCLIDQGGFSTADDLDPFVISHSTAYFYKGTSAKFLDGKNFLISKEVKKLFICNALGYQVKLLDLMYSPRSGNGYSWNLPLNVDAEYFKQICNVKPNAHMSKDGNGMEFANWCVFGADRRDFFDAEKMCLAALDIAIAYLPQNQWVKGHIPLFAAKAKLLEAIRLKHKGR